MRSTLQDHDPELLKSIRPINCPELYEDDNDVYFSRFDGSKPYEPLEDVRTLREFLSRLEKLCSFVRRFMTWEHIVAFNVINGGLRDKQQEQQAKSWWNIDPDTLTANELLFLICYPFFRRWGGSFEVRFALSGDLGKCLSLYRKKLKEETEDLNKTERKSEENEDHN